MSQTGYTPILLYATATASSVPTAANLTSTPTGAELAINYTDGKLYYKDNTGTVQLLASKSVASISLPLSAANGGTGVSGTLTGVLYGNGTSAQARPRRQLLHRSWQLLVQLRSQTQQTQRRSQTLAGGA